MQRVVLDTNLIISALISTKGISFKIINELVYRGKITLFISEPILNEYKDVCSRGRFAKYPSFYEEAFRVIDFIGSYAVRVDPIEKFSLLADEDDNMYLDLAYACNADYIITGNSNHFVFPNFHQTLIVSPRQYWEQHKPQ